MQSKLISPMCLENFILFYQWNILKILAISLKCWNTLKLKKYSHVCHVGHGLYGGYGLLSSDFLVCSHMAWCVCTPASALVLGQLSGHQVFLRLYCLAILGQHTGYYEKVSVSSGIWRTEGPKCELPLKW